MGFIKFDKSQLINLEYALKREMLRSNRAGSFSCTTIIGCNTRKYHGLLICPQPLMDNETHVLLSKIEETVIQREEEFNIGISKYPGTYSPKGHKYVRNFSADIVPKVTYRVGGVVLTKETMFVSGEERVMVKYTLEEAQSPTTIRVKPFLAFRNIHSLSKRNLYLDTKYEKAAHGVRIKMYEGYSPLHMQFSKKEAQYFHAPDWYDDIEYFHEKDRGYECLEDLYVPGFFEFPIKRGESVIFCAGTKEIAAGQISRSFNKELKNRTPRNTFGNALVNSAEQFFNTREKEGTDILAGYPWYDRIGRYTFISLPGLSIARGHDSACSEVIETMISQMRGGFFPETGRGAKTTYDAADTSLWFIWALQHCCCQKIKPKDQWKKYSEVIKQIVNAYAFGNEFFHLRDNGLIYINKNYPNLTWMNSMVNHNAVTPRYGYVVEINALWYNALMFSLEAAKAAGDKEFVERWSELAASIPESFQATFWNEESQALADFVADDWYDNSFRPNQIIAAALPYCALDGMMVKQVVDMVTKQLLTPRGLRTLSPKDSFYKGRYVGNEIQRDMAMHQGCAYPWLLGLYSDAYLKVYAEKGHDFIDKLFNGFQDEMTVGAIGSINELYDGDPPHQGGASISFAASIAELIRVFKNLGGLEKKEQN